MTKLYKVKAEVTISVPASSEETARESVHSWISEANSAIGGLSPHLDNMVFEDVYEHSNRTESEEVAE